MGKKKEKAYNKHLYKRANYKYYVKGNNKVERSDKLSDWVVKGVALAFYPFYLVYSGMKGAAGKVQSFFQNRFEASNTNKRIELNFSGFSKASDKASGLLKAVRRKNRQFNIENIAICQKI